MKAIILYRNIPKSRILPSRIVPRWGITKAIKHLAESDIRTVTVGKNGIYADSEKVRWSRLTAWRLRRLGVKEIQVETSSEIAPLVAGLSKALDVYSFEEGYVNDNNDVIAIDIETEDGKEEYIRHPLATTERILTIINDRNVDKEVVKNGLRKLDARGEFLDEDEEINLSMLSSRALIALVSYTKDPKKLTWILKNIHNSPWVTDLAFLALRKLKPDHFLADLDKDIINTNFSNLDDKDFAYLAEHMPEVRQKLIECKLEELKQSQKKLFKIRRFKKLQKLGAEINLEHLSDLTLAVLVEELDPKDHPYFTQRMKDALLALVHGEEIGEKFVRALKKIEKHKDPDIARVLELYTQFRAIRIEIENERVWMEAFLRSRSREDNDDGK